jgi:hypothetical protein
VRLVPIIRRLILRFRARQQQTVTRCPVQPENPPPPDDLPAGFIPIETQVSGQHIDGTSRWIGEIARVGQMPSGELITCIHIRGVRCGCCGRIVNSVHERITETGVLAGIGGVCGNCMREGNHLVRCNAISAFQAEAMALYCSQCASHCDSCGRHDICSRHARLFVDPAGQKQSLCPECLKKAEQKRLFAQTLNTMAWFLSEDHSSPSKRHGEPDGY